MTKRWLSFFLVLSITVCGLAVKKDEDEAGLSPATPSILKAIPGLVQLKSGKILKGGLLCGLFTAGLVGAISSNHLGNKYYADYQASSDVQEIVTLRKKTEKYFRQRNIYICGILGTWLVHLIDLKWSKGKNGGLKGKLSTHTFSIGYYFSF